MWRPASLLQSIATASDASPGRHLCLRLKPVGAGGMHTINAFLEAEAFDGPSLIIAYSHCIAHGYDMVYGMDQVDSRHQPANGKPEKVKQ